MKKWKKTDDWEVAFNNYNDNVDEIEQGFYNRYTKQEVDDELNTKADKLDTYTKTEVDTSLGLKANKQQEEWITPTLLNGWEPFAIDYSQPGYYKDEFGIVHLRGMVKNVSGAGTHLLTLPSGYAPAKKSYLVGGRAGADACRITLSDWGGLYLESNSPTWTSLDGISFKGGV